MPTIFHYWKGQWRAERLASKHGVLRFAPVRVEAHDSPPTHSWGEGIVLTPIDRGRAWVAFAPAAFPVLHNSQPIRGGLRVLAHGDLLALGSESVFFSTEKLAEVETFSGSDFLQCPRCKIEITAGQEVVRCPSCQVIHHQYAERKCWSYSPTCAMCEQSSALDAGLRWSPESL